MICKKEGVAAPRPRVCKREGIGDLTEELDATRKEVLAEHADLTLTGLYNLRDKLLKGETFTDAEQDQRRRGRVDIIAELHDHIDAAVAYAYGWPHDLSDEQIAKAGLAQLPAKSKAEQIEALLPEAKAKKPAFPRDAIGQTAAVLADLRGGVPMTPTEIAARYSQGRRVEQRIAATLQALVRLGHVAIDGEGNRLRRAA